MDSEQLGKIKQLQSIPGVLGVFVLDANSKILDGSSQNRELLSIDATMLVQNATTMIKHIDQSDDPHLIEFITGSYEYQISPEAGNTIVVVKGL